MLRHRRKKHPVENEVGKWLRRVHGRKHPHLHRQRQADRVQGGVFHPERIPRRHEEKLVEPVEPHDRDAIDEVRLQARHDLAQMLTLRKEVEREAKRGKPSKQIWQHPNGRVKKQPHNRAVRDRANGVDPRMQLCGKQGGPSASKSGNPCDRSQQRRGHDVRSSRRPHAKFNQTPHQRRHEEQPADQRDVVTSGPRNKVERQPEAHRWQQRDEQSASWRDQQQKRDANQPQQGVAVLALLARFA